MDSAECSGRDTVESFVDDFAEGSRNDSTEVSAVGRIGDDSAEDGIMVWSSRKGSSIGPLRS